jgi:flavin-dependent dehydrogenase
MNRFADDVIVVGAGPAGAVAATVLARAGAHVRLLDRAWFPRDKLCGDTLNPGAIAELERLDLAHPLDSLGLPVEGMRVTGPGGVSVESRYPAGLRGRALLRRELDWALVQQAISAGVRFEPSLPVHRAIVEEAAGAKKVAGVIVGVHGRERALRAHVTIAADGRRSTLAFSLGLSRHPRVPRRWAIGGYFEGASGLTSLGEMHIRRGVYIGVAGVPGGYANVCVVRPSQPADAPLRDPARLLATELARDEELRDRFARARLIKPPVVLGPLAVDSTGSTVDGLLLAGDAAGFIDPMTGDGLRFAVRGGVLAADGAIKALASGWRGVPMRVEAARRREFAGKWRLNRTLRATVGSPPAVRAGAIAAGLWPGLVRRIIAAAGDCGLALRCEGRSPSRKLESEIRR